MDENDNQPGQRFEQYIPSIRESIVKSSPPDKNFNCPCCGYPTLTVRASYEICKLCYWEDDGQDDPRADEVWGGPNKDYSLTEARANFKHYLIMYNPDRDPPAFTIWSDAAIKAKKAIVNAFDAMPNTDDRQQLYQTIEENSKILQQETLRRVEEYEQTANRVTKE